MIDENELPLKGLRVLDFGHYLAGPAVGMILADQGAEVIRIDPPGGPRWKNHANAILGRGKKSIVLDMKTGQDQKIAQGLAARSDLLVENFRPGVMDRLGLGADKLMTANPALVYLSLPGFSSRDDKLSSIKAFEGVIAAASGQFTDMGLSRVLMGINPSFTPLPLASAYAATLGATAAVLALTKRKRTGSGERIEVPLASALLEGLVYNAMYVENYPDRYKSPREREIERRQAAGIPMNMKYGEIQEFLDPLYRTYLCADGRPFYVVCASHKHHVVNALKLMGLWDELQADGLPNFDAYLATDQWPEGQNCTLTAYPLSPKWAKRVSAALQKIFKTRTAFDWERIWGEAGIPAAAHRTSREWLHSKHALTSGLVLELEDAELGRTWQMGNLVWLTQSAKKALDKSGAPMADANHDEILKILDEPVRAKPGQKNTDDGGYLEGIKILDLTNVIAGPTIASTLARFGAEVISLVPTEPTMDPWNTVIFGFQAGRGKRSLICDLKTTRGQDILSRLLTDVDVITLNGLERQLPGLGLDRERLQAINPKLVLCLFDAWGGPAQGQRSGYPGYDDLVQASTGVMARFGGSLDTPEEHAHLGTIDVLGGFAAALAISMALYQGEGGTARASLAAAGQLIQLPFMIDYEDRPPFDEPAGRAVKGWGPLYHCYEATDGWFFLAIGNETLTELIKNPGLEGIAGLDGAELQQAMSKCFRQENLAHWAGLLQGIDAGFSPLATLQVLREENLQVESEGLPDLADSTYSFVRHDQHPSGRFVDIVAPNAIRPHASRITIPFPARKYGSDSRTLLAELGYSSDEIDTLICQGVVSESWCEDYLPE